MTAFPHPTPHPSSATLAPGETRASNQTPTVPLPPECLGLLSPCRSWAKRFTLLTATQGKEHLNRRKPPSFLFSSAGECKVIFGPSQYKSDCFLSFFLKALCLAGFRQGSAPYSSHFEYLCIFAWCRFCLSSSAWLSLCLRIVDFPQTLLSSQRK